MSLPWKQFLVITLTLSAILFAQSKPQFDFCGLGSHHECNCIRHTQEVRQKFIDECQKRSKSDKDLDACLKGMPAHCNLADRYVDWDGDGNSTDIPMASRCTMACKKSDCKCDDGPTCHFAHSPEDHRAR